MTGNIAAGEDALIRASRVLIGLAISMVLAAIAWAPVARADIFAATEKTAVASQDRDIMLVNATLGTSLGLPAGINTAADEFHPSVSADGKKIVFEREDRTANTVRIIMADLSTGQSADLFNGFDAQSIRPRNPSITPDGRAVLVGADQANGPLLVDVSNFPAGPYPRTTLAGVPAPVDPVASGSTPGSPLAFSFFGGSSTNPRLDYGTIGGTSFKEAPLPAGSGAFHPTIGTPGGTATVVYASAPVGAKDNIDFCSPISPGSTCQRAPFPSNVNTPDEESDPAFTPDSRYVGFERFAPNTINRRLFLWSVDTQGLLEPDGLDLGAYNAGVFSSNLSLWEKPVLHATSISTLGVVSFNLLGAAKVGILVQRVIGRHRLFGHTVPKLGAARRVPLGSFKRGRRHVHWNLRVGGRRLRPGTYQLTVRALTRSGKVRDLGKPHRLRIHG